MFGTPYEALRKLPGTRETPDDLYKRLLNAQTARLQAESLQAKGPESWQARRAGLRSTAADTNAKAAQAAAAVLRDESLTDYERGRPSNPSEWMSWMGNRQRAFDANRVVEGQPPVGLTVIPHAPRTRETRQTAGEYMKPEEGADDGQGSTTMPQSPYGALKTVASSGFTSRDIAARLELAAAQEAEARAKAAGFAARAADPEAQMNEQIFNLRTGRAAAVAGGRQDVENEVLMRKARGEAAAYFEPSVAMKRLQEQAATTEANRARYGAGPEATAAGNLERQRLINEGNLARSAASDQTRQLIAVYNNLTRAVTTMSLDDPQREAQAQLANQLRGLLTSMGVPLGQ